MDGLIYLSGSGDYAPGNVVKAEITGSDVYDLTGKIINETQGEEE